MSFGIPVRNGLALGLTPSTTLASGRIGGRPALLLNFISTTALPSTITFSRGTQATLTDSTGKITYAPNNLLTNSESFEASAWTKANGTVTANAAAAPDGTLTADKFVPNTTSASHAVQQTVTTSGTVVVSFYAKAAGYSYAVISSSSNNYVYFDVANGAVASTAGTGWSSPVVTFAGNGWYRCSAVTSVANTRYDILCYNTTQASGNSAPTFAGDGTSGILIWGAQLEAVTYQTTPGTYNSTTPKNLLGYTQEFDNAAWTKSNSFVQTNLTTYSGDASNAVWATAGAAKTSTNNADPFGTNTALLVTADGTNTNHYIQQGPSISFTSGTAYTQSVWVKAGTIDRVQLTFGSPAFGSSQYANFYLSGAGSVTAAVGGTATITPYANGWYRIAFTATATATTSIQSIFVIVITSGTDGRVPSNTSSGTFLAIGAQIVQGATAGDYQPTYAAAAAVQYAAPDGTLSADKLVEDATANVHFVLRSGSGTVGVTEVLSCYAKAAERSWVQLQLGASPGASAYFNLATGTVGTTANGTATITAVGNGWYRCSIAATRTGNANNFINIATADGVSSYTGDGTSGIYIWGAQLSNSASLDPYVYNPGAAPTSAAYYGPRFDYDPVTLAPKGLLIEEQRSNLLTYSEQFDNAAWSKLRATVTANATTSPDGTVNADQLLDTAVAGTHVAIQTITKAASAIAYAGTVYVKKDIRDQGELRLSDQAGNGVRCTFNITTGAVGAATAFGTGFTVGSSTITPLNNGWYRIALTCTSNTATTLGHEVYIADASGNTSYTGTGAGFYIYGAQLEAGAFATSYIPTVASTVTRTADIAQMLGTNFSSWYNTTTGTFVAAADTAGGTGSSRVVANASGTSIFAYLHSSASAGANYDGTNLLLTGNTASVNTTFKIASAYDGGATTKAVVLNGSTVASGAYSGAYSSATLMYLGGGSAGIFLNGHIRTLSYYNTRLTNTQLQVLTT